MTQVTSSLRGFLRFPLYPCDMKQIQVLGGFPTIRGYVNPMFHQQRGLGMLHGDVRPIAHDDCERDEWLC